MLFVYEYRYIMYMYEVGPRQDPGARLRDLRRRRREGRRGLAAEVGPRDGWRE